MKRILAPISAVILTLPLIWSCTEEQETPVASVALNQPTAEMMIGETITLKATIAPSNATDKEITWSSSNPSVASVDQDGTVKALAEGETTITASAGGKQDQCIVTVSQKIIKVSSIVLNPQELTLTEEDDFVLEATIIPDNSTNTTLIWSTSDNSIATVDDNGCVKAIKEGEAIITARIDEVSASCHVIVQKKFIAVSSIELNRHELSLVEDEEFVLEATIKPDDATDKTVIWETLDNSIASVDNEGRVKCIKAGETKITAKAGECVDECLVTVKEKWISVTGIKLNKYSLAMNVGEEFQLVATIIPDNATDKTIQWSSKNREVATVDSNSGLVKAIKEGSTSIIVTADGKSVECRVYVNAIPVQSLTLNQSSLTLYNGEEYTLVATVKPDNATYKDVIWESDDVNIATVDDGKITAIKKGKTTITASANGQTAKCQVEVLSSVTGISLDCSSLHLYTGTPSLLTCHLIPEDATPRGSIVWNSSDKSVVEILDVEEEYYTGIGIIGNAHCKGVNPGSAIISVSVDGYKADCQVTVEYIPVSTITISPSDVSLYIGETKQLSATVYPSSAHYDHIEWVSQDESIAAVDDNGVVRAVGKGNVIIYAKVGDKEARCSIAVHKALEDISFEQPSVIISPESSTTLRCVLSPEDATPKEEIKWTSSNPSVATVNNQGVVQAYSIEGWTDITASVEKYSATCRVQVVKPIVKKITLNKTNLYFTVGEAETLVATIEHNYEFRPPITWTSSDKNIATVDWTGRVYAISKGACQIIASANDDSGVKATCEVWVNNPAPEGAIDLGLSVFWAKNNLGASSPEEYGDYYAWGETEPHYSSLNPLVWKTGMGSGYSYLTYKWCNGSYDKLTKYNTKSSFGSVDNKTTLEAQDDAARVLLGNNWRIPTKDEWNELKTRCTWESTNVGIVRGFVVTGPNGRSIFIPEAGQWIDTEFDGQNSLGCYWSSSLSTNEPNGAWVLLFYEPRYFNELDYDRCCGRTIRPVSD